MPTRRLPRTDDDRSAAMSTCNTKYQATAAPQRLISPAQFTQLGALLSPWRSSRENLGTLLAVQTAATSTCETCLHKSAQINSHFIQVMNFAIDRGVLAASVRAFYDLPVSHAEVPPMDAVADALQWGGKLAAGEIARLAAGGAALAWPTIGQVNTITAQLQTNADAQTTAKDGYDLGQEELANQRPDVDTLIKDLWDTIEFSLRTETPSSLRRKAREWGVVYDGDEEEEPPTPPPGP